MHCGGCDQPCEVKEPLVGQESNGGCIGGICQPWWGGCFMPYPGDTCASRCSAEGGRCAPLGCDGTTLMIYDVDVLCELAEPGSVDAADCTADLGTFTETAVRCCCK